MAEDKKGKSLTLSVSFRFCMYVSSCLLALLPSSFSNHPEFRTMFLNSYVHCGHGDAKELWYKVGRNSVYNVKDDVRPDAGTHAFRSCEMVFRSTRRDGRLCMMQRQLRFDTFDVQLELFDGWIDVEGVSEPNKTLNHAQGLMFVEWCTSGRYLTVRMSESGPKPSVRKVDIDLLIYDMQSYHRKASMDSLPSCGSKFLMDGSQINVTNLDPRGKVKDIFPKCSLTFEYVGHEENRTLCLVFESSNVANPRCSKLNYSLNIFSFHLHPETGKVQKIPSGTRSCGRPTPRQWCSNSTKLSLELHRELGPGNTIVAEDSIVFYALVVDHEGGPESLPSLFVAPPESSTVDEGALIAIVCGSIAFVILILLIIIAIVVHRRRRRKNEEKQKGKELEYTVRLTPNENGHTSANNYSEGLVSSRPADV